MQAKIAYDGSTDLLAVAADTFVYLYQNASTELEFLCHLASTPVGFGAIHFGHTGTLYVFHNIFMPRRRMPRRRYVECFVANTTLLVKSAVKR